MFRSLGVDGATFLPFDAELASLDGRSLRRESPGRAACLERRRRRLGFSFRQGPLRLARTFCEARAPGYGFAVDVVDKVVSRPSRRAMSSPRQRSGARSSRATSRRPRAARPPLCRRRTVIAGPEARPHARRAHRQFRARADQSARAWRLCRARPRRRPRPTTASPASASGRRSTTARRCWRPISSILRGDLYGREIEVAFVARIREERKFDSLDALKAEMDARQGARAQILGVARREPIWRFRAKSSNPPAHAVGKLQRPRQPAFPALIAT